MAGSQTLRTRGGRFAVVLALCFFTCAGRARAQNPSPPLPPSGMPDQSFASIVLSTPETTDGPTTVPQPSYYPGFGMAPPGTRVEMGLYDTITESICGQPDPDTWRPLLCSTLFSEG